MAKFKTINDLTDKKVSEHLKNFGAFWAFSNSQVNEQKKEGENYVQVMQGLICPKDKADEFMRILTEIYEAGEREFLEVNDRTEIILYELENHECFYLYDPTEAVENLADFGITKEEVINVFNKNLERYADN